MSKQASCKAQNLEFRIIGHGQYDKLDSFIKRLRWKAFFFDTDNQNKENDKPTYGFKTEANPPQHEGLKNFEHDIYKMVRRVQFKPVKNKFQSELFQDAKRIRNSSKVFVPADKTTNLYTMQVSEYKKLLNDNITAKYKKASNQVIKNINKEAMSIATNLELDNRIEQYSNKSAFIIIKDHKPNFPNSFKCRLINPATSQIDIISKQLLDNINHTIRFKKHLN